MNKMEYNIQNAEKVLRSYKGKKRIYKNKK